MIKLNPLEDFKKSCKKMPTVFLMAMLLQGRYYEEMKIIAINEFKTRKDVIESSVNLVIMTFGTGKNGKNSC